MPSVHESPNMSARNMSAARDAGCLAAPLPLPSYDPVPRPPFLSSAFATENSDSHVLRSAQWTGGWADEQVPAAVVVHYRSAG